MAELPKDAIFHFHSDDGITIKIDIIPFVRCRECKYYHPNKRSWTFMGFVESNWCSLHGNHNCNGDWFCAGGIMKDVLE